MDKLPLELFQVNSKSTFEENLAPYRRMVDVDRIMKLKERTRR